MKISFAEFVRELSDFPFVIVDAGAHMGPKSEWVPLKKYLKLVGFEPNKDNYENLREDENMKYINSACYNKQADINLHVTKIGGLSSIFIPNYDFLEHFADENTHGYELKEKVSVGADKIDNLLSGEIRKHADIIKVDVEGAALEVLQGAEETIKNGNVVCCLIEAEFNQKYKGESLFSDVDLFLRKYDYQIFEIKPCYWKRREGTKTGGARGQLVHGDFIYFMNTKSFLKKINDLESKERAAKIIKYIVITCMYGFYDLALEIIEESHRKDFIDDRRYALVKKKVLKTSSILMRMPKLEYKGTLSNVLYHVYMLLGGIWLKRKRFHRATIEF
jgi:FkbM family methyltransferase